MQQYFCAALLEYSVVAKKLFQNVRCLFPLLLSFLNIYFWWKQKLTWQEQLMNVIHYFLTNSSNS